MRILFAHPNFPAQFKHVAKAAAANGHEVYFLCQTHFGRSIPGVARLKLKGKLSGEALRKKNLNIFERTKFLGEQYREGYKDLKLKTWSPDLVISHSGWGCGLYVKEIWPETKLISYLEWWFDPLSDFFSYDETNKDIGINTSHIKKHYERNFFVSMELSNSDYIISPTHWQREQLPNSFRKQCSVIFDGSNVDSFKNISTDKNSPPKITYGTRGMDAMRGFPQLIKTIPMIKSEFKGKIKVEIAGDETAYYGSTPSNHKTWKTWAIEYLKNENCEDIVTWKGFLKPQQYIEWLKSSWCHLYFTHPFVASWSLIDALAAGIPIIASDVRPVIEFCGNVDGVKLVDHRSTQNIVTAISKILNEQCYGKREFSRSIEYLSVENALKGWGTLIGVDLTTKN